MSYSILIQEMNDVTYAAQVITLAQNYFSNSADQ